MTAEPALLVQSPEEGRLRTRSPVAPVKTRPAVRSAEGMCRLLREDCELAEAIPEPRRARAIEQCTSRTVRIPVGGSLTAAAGQAQDGIGLLILDGLVSSRIWLQGRCGLELLGEGDLLQPSAADDAWPMLPVASRCSVLAPLRLAVLDGEFVARLLARYPDLAPPLVERAVRRSRHLAVQLAIVNQPRVEDRLLLLLWHLAGRWGRVCGDGVLLELRLTHALLAELVAARRPTVSSALASLARRTLVRRVRRGWWLAGSPDIDGRRPELLHTCNGFPSPHASGDRRRSPVVPRRVGAPDQGAAGA
jgi:CRP/FNR family cyclic AMP-dependent transcriptional regulator